MTEAVPQASTETNCDRRFEPTDEQALEIQKAYFLQANDIRFSLAGLQKLTAIAPQYGIEQALQHISNQSGEGREAIALWLIGMMPNHPSLRLDIQSRIERAERPADKAVFHALLADDPKHRTAFFTIWQDAVEECVASEKKITASFYHGLSLMLATADRWQNPLEDTHDQSGVFTMESLVESMIFSDTVHPQEWGETMSDTIQVMAQIDPDISISLLERVLSDHRYSSEHRSEILMHVIEPISTVRPEYTKPIFEEAYERYSRHRLEITRCLSSIRSHAAGSEEAFISEFQSLREQHILENEGKLDISDLESESSLEITRILPHEVLYHRLESLQTDPNPTISDELALCEAISTIVSHDPTILAGPDEQILQEQLRPQSLGFQTEHHDKTVVTLKGFAVERLREIVLMHHAKMDDYEIGQIKSALNSLAILDSATYVHLFHQLLETKEYRFLFQIGQTLTTLMTHDVSRGISYMENIIDYIHAQERVIERYIDGNEKSDAEVFLHMLKIHTRVMATHAGDVSEILPQVELLIDRLFNSYDEDIQYIAADLLDSLVGLNPIMVLSHIDFFDTVSEIHKSNARNQKQTILMHMLEHYGDKFVRLPEFMYQDSVHRRFAYHRYMELRHRGISDTQSEKNVREDVLFFAAMQGNIAKMNESLPSEKQLVDATAFWEEYIGQISQLWRLGGKAVKGFLKDIAYHSGYESLSEKLELIDTIDDATLDSIALLYADSRITGHHDARFLLMLLEYASGYSGIRLDGYFAQDCRDILDLHGGQVSVDVYVQEIGIRLITRFAREMNISQDRQFDIGNWNLSYLHKVFAAMEKFEKKSDMLKLVVKMTLLGDFYTVFSGRSVDMLPYTMEEQTLMAEIARNTDATVRDMFVRGINIQEWFGFDQEKTFTVEWTKETKEAAFEVYRGNLELRLSRIFAADPIFKENFTLWAEQQSAAAWEANGALTIHKLDAVKNKLLELILPIKDREESPSGLSEVVDDLYIQLVYETGLFTVETIGQKKYTLGIRLWKRDPMHDLFQGFYTHNCLALDSNNGDAMLGYLLDPSVNIFEVFDTLTGKTIGQTFVFLMDQANEDGSLPDIPEVILAMDNIEIHRDYMGFSGHIRKHLFEFARSYTKAVAGRTSLKRVVLGATTANDVTVSDLKKESLPVYKMSRVSGIKDVWPLSHQYFEALHVDDGWVDVTKLQQSVVFDIGED